MAIDSLPNRPLTMKEGDALAYGSDIFSPMGVLERLPEGTEVDWGDAPADNELHDPDVAEQFVYTLFYADDDRGVGLAFSEQDNSWHKVVESSADNYDHEKIEQRTHEFAVNHMEKPVDDEGFIH